MNARVQRKPQRTKATARRRQALLVRAVVGSLVLCAALAPPALSQTGGAQGVQQKDAAAQVKEFHTVHAVPFRELLAKTQRLIAAGELNSQDVFDFVIEAERNADGSLRDIKFTESAAANGRWRSVAHEFIMVLSESGALSALTDADHLTFTLRLDERASARLQTIVKSAEQATQLAQNYNTLLEFGRVSQRGRAGIEVLNNMAFSANGKQLTMQLEMSREQVGNLLRQQLSLP
ncbi:MAG TPA: hypothetical protein VGO96_12130 [Pyrinomonadaceae bacterium]|jgi:hypothetical protein|nr:hypothetical protein [Pyrinomonadaceae bacterium]